MLGSPLGGLLISTVGWQSIFVINIPIGIFGFIYSNRLLRILEPDDPDTHIDFLGAFFQGTGVILLLLFLNRLNDPKWSRELLFMVLTLSLSGIFAFFVREVRTSHPLLGLSIFSYRQFSIALGVMMIAFTCNASGLVLIPFYLEEILHLVPKQVGLVLVTIPVCTMLVAPVSGRISDAIGVRFLTALGMATFVGGIFWISTLDQQATRLDVVLRLVVIGIGLGIFQTPNSSALMSAVPKRLVGIASGVLAVGRNLGIGGGVAVSTAIFTYRRGLNLQSSGPEAAFVEAFSWVISCFGFVAIAAVILCAFRKNRTAARGEGLPAGYRTPDSEGP